MSMITLIKMVAFHQSYTRRTSDVISDAKLFQRHREDLAFPTF
jgi:hypothetical protein